LTVALESLRASREEAAAGRLAEIVGAPPSVPALLGGRPGAMVSSAGKARLVAADGDSLWVLTAEGARAQELLEKVAAGWQWVSPI
jgi:hypothetical protein